MAGPALDVGEVGRFLEGRVPAFRGLRDATKFSGGQSNPTYRLDADSGCYVLRAQPPGTLLPSAHRVDREYRVMHALRGSDVPVPEVLLLAQEGSPLGRDFVLMEFVPGRIFWDPALPDLPREEVRAIYGETGRVLAALHSVDPSACGLADYGRHGSYFARQLERWTGQYRASRIRERPEMDELIRRLEARLPADDGACAIVHGDYRLDNLIFAEDEPRVVAVLDWELSTLGHPLADLAYQCMQWRLPHTDEFRGLAGVDRAARGIPDEREYMSAYLARRGAGRIDDWPFYLAFSFFRLASILEGVARRGLAGNASNPEQAARYGAAVPVIAEAALAVTEEER